MRFPVALILSLAAAIPSICSAQSANYSGYLYPTLNAPAAPENYSGQATYGGYVNGYSALPPKPYGPNSPTYGWSPNSHSPTIMQNAGFAAPAPAASEPSLADKIAGEIVPAEEIEPQPSWFSPNYWFPATIWDGNVELGINGSTGNSDSFSMKTGGKAKRKTKTSVLDFNIAYVKTNTNSMLTQHNAIMNAKAEYLFQESPWTAFTRLYGEYDEFKAYDVRLALNAGLGYRWFESDSTKLTTRLGAGWSREFGGPDDRFVPEGLAGVDVERQISKRQKFQLTSDYFPDWGNFDSYRIVTDASWRMLLDEEHNLSLKVGAVDRYDSTPNGRKPNDLNYSIVLLWEL